MRDAACPGPTTGGATWATGERIARGVTWCTLMGEIENRRGRIVFRLCAARRADMSDCVRSSTLPDPAPAPAHVLSRGRPLPSSQRPKSNVFVEPSVGVVAHRPPQRLGGRHRHLDRRERGSRPLDRPLHPQLFCARGSEENLILLIIRAAPVAMRPGGGAHFQRSRAQ